MIVRKAFAEVAALLSDSAELLRVRAALDDAEAGAELFASTWARFAASWVDLGAEICWGIGGRR